MAKDVNPPRGGSGVVRPHKDAQPPRPATTLTDEDVERIAERVIAKLREVKEPPNPWRDKIAKEQPEESPGRPVGW